MSSRQKVLNPNTTPGQLRAMRTLLKRHTARLTEGAIVTFARLVCAPRIHLEQSLEMGPRRVFFANHRSNGDTILIWAALPPELRKRVRPVAAADYWLKSELRKFIGLDVFRVLPIERRAEARTTDPVADMADAIAGGWSLIVFPEGSRNQTDAELLPFKTGIYHLACAQPGIEFVPVWIDNLNGVLPKGEVLPVPLICDVRFGAPLTLAEGEDKDGFLARARAALLSLRPAEAA